MTWSVLAVATTEPSGENATHGELLRRMLQLIRRPAIRNIPSPDLAIHASRGQGPVVFENATAHTMC